MVRLESDPDQPANESKFLFKVYTQIQTGDVILPNVINDIVTTYLKYPKNKQNKYIIEIMKETHPEYFI